MKTRLVLACLLLAVPSCKQSDSGATAAKTSAPAASAGVAQSAAAPEGTVPAPASSTQLSFGTGFEGAIGMRTSNAKGASPDMLFLTKGGKLRVDVPGKHGSEVAHTIFDPAGGTLMVIMDTQKLALQMPAPSIAAPSSAGPPSTITRTGKHETIAGYDCEDWNVTTGAKHSAVCVAEGIPFFDFAAMASHGGAATGRSWADELRDKKGFPLRAVETDESGKETSRMEVTKIAKQTLDDELFTAPKGYNVMHVPGGAGLAGLANMPHPPK